jgi:hypothetical protein
MHSQTRYCLSMHIYVCAHGNLDAGFKNTDGFGLVTYSRVLSANKPMVIVMPRISESNSVANQPASITMSFQVFVVSFLLNNLGILKQRPFNSDFSN